MSTNFDPNTIINDAYHSAVLSGLIFVNCVVSKKLLKTSPPNLGQIDIKDGAKLTLNVFLAMMTNNWLVKQGILPQTIGPK